MSRETLFVMWLHFRKVYLVLYHFFKAKDNSLFDTHLTMNDNDACILYYSDACLVYICTTQKIFYLESRHIVFCFLMHGQQIMNNHHSYAERVDLSIYKARCRVSVWMDYASKFVCWVKLNRIYIMVTNKLWVFFMLVIWPYNVNSFQSNFQ